MKREKTSEYVVTSTVGEKVQAFIPQALPPRPPLELSGSLRDNLDLAHLEIGRLDGISTLLPDVGLFLYMYIRKEAVLSSQIEGTQSSLSDLLLFEMNGAPGVPVDDVREVSNYVAAMEHGLKRLREGFPLCNRLICEIHEKLLSKGRGAEKKPGEFRASQNWIGGTRPGNARFVPPPPERLGECLSAFEKFLNDEPERTPTLLKAALAHVQFETIHPFLDGNGRLGRLLITLLFCHEKVLNEPLLYLSLYFKQHRQAYYDLLQQVRTEGDWEAWTAFFTSASGALSRPRHSKLQDRSTYGNPIDFRGLRHEPVNEQGVVFLFGMIAKELGYMVEAVQTGFPDCEAKRQVDGGRWQRVRIEFEFESRNYDHPIDGCDVIICWRHNWLDCPPHIEVMELRNVIKSLGKSDE